MEWMDNMKYLRVPSAWLLVGAFLSITFLVSEVTAADFTANLPPETVVDLRVTPSTYCPDTATYQRMIRSCQRQFSACWGKAQCASTWSTIWGTSPTEDSCRSAF